MTFFYIVISSNTYEYQILRVHNVDISKYPQNLHCCWESRVETHYCGSCNNNNNFWSPWLPIWLMISIWAYPLTLIGEIWVCFCLQYMWFDTIMFFICISAHQNFINIFLRFCLIAFHLIGIQKEFCVIGGYNRSLNIFNSIFRY